jgi:hypothetical protein
MTHSHAQRRGLPRSASRIRMVRIGSLERIPVGSVYRIAPHGVAPDPAGLVADQSHLGHPNRISS